MDKALDKVAQVECKLFESKEFLKYITLLSRQAIISPIRRWYRVPYDSSAPSKLFLEIDLGLGSG